MSKRLKILNNEYSLTMQTKLNSSNYNLFVWVYKGKEKMPIYGSCFKENTPIKEIKQWAENRIKAQTILTSFYKNLFTMPTIYEMSVYLMERNYFIATLSPERILYYYNKLMMAQ